MQTSILPPLRTPATTGVSGNLKETEGHVVGSLLLTGTSMLLSVYFLAWQSYVLRADLILNAVLLGVYSLGGVLAFITVARFTRSAVARSSYYNLAHSLSLSYSFSSSSSLPLSLLRSLLHSRSLSDSCYITG